MVFNFRKLALETSEDVYEPAEDSVLLAESAMISGGTLLDVGTGTGLQALSLARFAEHVSGVDINPKAVELAKRNASANGIRNADFWLSDLFSNVKGRFDTIIFNPPYLPGEPVDMQDRALAGGGDGTEIINSFIDGVGAHMRHEGRVMLLVSSLNDIRSVKDRLASRGFVPEIIATKKMFFEELYVIDALFKSVP
jgi:release factor glutamine methyltransferase